MSNPQQLVEKLRNYRNELRDVGRCCVDDVEKLKCLRLLKMDDKQR